MTRNFFDRSLGADVKRWPSYQGSAENFAPRAFSPNNLQATSRARPANSAPACQAQSHRFLKCWRDTGFAPDRLQESRYQGIVGTDLSASAAGESVSGRHKNSGRLVSQRQPFTGSGMESISRDQSRVVFRKPVGLATSHLPLTVRGDHGDKSPARPGIGHGLERSPFP